MLTGHEDALRRHIKGKGDSNAWRAPRGLALLGSHLPADPETFWKLAKQFSGRAAVAGHLMPEAEVRCQNNPCAKNWKGFVGTARLVPQLSVPPSLASHTAAPQRRGLSSTTARSSILQCASTLNPECRRMAASHASRSSSRTIVPAAAWQIYAPSSCQLPALVRLEFCYVEIRGD